MDFTELFLYLLDVPAVSGLVVSVGAWVFAWIWRKKPRWEKYRGFIISAIKYAEKAADTSDGPSKMKWALNMVVESIEKSGKTVKPSMKAELENAISIVHDESKWRDSIPLVPGSPSTRGPELPSEGIPGMPGGTR